MRIRTKLFASLLTTTIGAGIGGSIGRMAGGFLAKSEEQIRAEHPEWTKEEVRNEYRRLVEKAKRHSAAYGFALGSQNNILTSAALGGATGRFVIEPERKYIERVIAVDPTITRRQAELMYEKEKDSREALGAFIGGAGSLLVKHAQNEYKKSKNNNNQEVKKKRRWLF